MSTEGNGDHSNDGCDSGKLLACQLPSKATDFECKHNTVTLISDIAEENSVCFNSSIQDGDQTELFYNIVCGSDLPVGENVSISSPQQSEAPAPVIFSCESTMAFSERANTFPPVDVVVHPLDEPLDNLTLTVPDFKLNKNTDSQSDVATIQMKEQQKKLEESISAIAKSLGLEDLIPETFNVDNNKDLFPVTVTSDNLDIKQTSPLATTSDFKEPVELHLPDLPIQFTADSDLLDNYNFLSTKKKGKVQDSSNASFMGVPVVMSDGRTGYVICSKEEASDKKNTLASSNMLLDEQSDNMYFPDIVTEANDSKYISDSNIINETLTFDDLAENDDNMVSEEAVECVLQSETDAAVTEIAEPDEQQSTSIEENVNEISVSDLLSKVLDDSEKNTSEPTTVSISTNNANKKMQIVFMTSQGQQVIEIDTDALGVESLMPLSPKAKDVEDDDFFCISDVTSLKKPTVCESDQLNEGLDDMDDEMACEEDLAEFVKKISPRRGKRKSWVCPVEGCQQIFNKECKLRVHMINHKGARPFKCTMDGCDWAFTTPYRLRRHYETHIGKKDYICDFQGCNRRFTTVYNLNTHKKRHIWSSALTCPADGCDLSFDNRRKLELHLRVHDNIEAPYKCKVCGKKYYSANCIASHYRTHQYSEEDFRCPFENCGKKYDKFCRLKQHIRHHTGERPYTCPAAGCKWSFMSASKLTRHMRKHTGERKFVCNHPGCGKSFMRPEHLKGHVVIHSGDKPFHCPHENCNARFTAKSSLYVHVKKHCASGIKIVYPCPITACVKKYNNRATLRQHIQKVHPNALKDGKKFEIPEKLELTMPVSIAVPENDPEQSDELSPNYEQSSSKELICNMPMLMSSPQCIRLSSAKAGKSVSSTSKSKNTDNQGKSATPSAIKQLSPSKRNTPSSTDLVSGRLLQENHSGSARTDYCCNRLKGSTKKLWSLQNRVRLGFLHNSEDGKNPEPSSSLNSPISQSSASVRSPDVLLASSSVALQDSSGTHFLQDEPSSSIYHEDSILENSSAFISSSLLSDNSDSNSSSVMTHDGGATSFSATNSVDDFNVSAINLQCLD